MLKTPKEPSVYAIIDDDYEDVKPNVELLNQNMCAPDSNAASSETSPVSTSNLNALSIQQSLPHSSREPNERLFSQVQIWVTLE